MMFYPLPAASIVGVFAAVKKLRPDKIKTAVFQAILLPRIYLEINVDIKGAKPKFRPPRHVQYALSFRRILGGPEFWLIVFQ